MIKQWIQKLFSKTNNTKQEQDFSQDMNNMNTMYKRNQQDMMKFDIIVYEYDDNGNKIERTENGIQAPSAEDLISMYRNCGVNVRIIKAYGNEQTQQMQNQQIQIPKQANEINQVQENQQTQVVPEKFRYFKIGNIECRLETETGKIYQREWVNVNKLDGISLVEGGEYRIVSDSTNKVVPLNGKHIEVEGWVVTKEE